MSDVENKTIDFKQTRHARAMAAYTRESERLASATWWALNDLWNALAEGLPEVPGMPFDKEDGTHGGELKLSGDPGVVFERVLLGLVTLAQAHGVDNEEIVQSLVNMADLTAVLIKEFEGGDDAEINE
jgi:hypothetical protein